MNERVVKMKLEYPRAKREMFEDNIGFTIRAQPFNRIIDKRRNYMMHKKHPFVQRTLLRRLSEGFFCSTPHKRWAWYAPCRATL